MRWRALLFAAFFAVPAASANAAPGDLVYKGCISSDTNQASCAQLPIPNAGGGGTALSSPKDVVESPDRAHVYVLAGASHSIVWFNRSASTGALTFAGCLTASSGTVGCPAIRTATPNGLLSGMGLPTAIAIAPDGRSVFVTGVNDDALILFSRDASTGALSFERCVSSNSALNGTCDLMPKVSADGTKTALDYAMDVVVSPDNANVYVSSFQSDALSRFGRNPSTGAFTGFQECLTGDIDVANFGACASVGGATAGGTGHRMNFLSALAAAPDGKSIVAGSRSSVVDFARGAGGILTVGGCVTSDTGTAGCSGTFANTAGGTTSALHGPSEVTVSPNNENIYVGSQESDAVSVIGRNATTGAIEGFEGCRTSNPSTVGCAFDPGSGPYAHLDSVSGVAVSPDNAMLYAVADFGDALTWNDRRASDGAFFFNECLTTNTTPVACSPVSPSATAGTNTPLNGLQAVVPSADGKDVYVVGQQHTIAHFEVEGARPPVTPPGDQPPGTQPPGGTPSNEFSIAGVAKNKKKGTAQLTVTVPGPGALGLDGNGIKERAATPAAAGDVTLKLKTDGNKRKKLRRKGKVKVTPLVTFTPTGGTANTESAKVKLIDR